MTTPGIRPLVAGNWKMNGLKASRRELESLIRRYGAGRPRPKCDILICPPATLIALFAQSAARSAVRIGAQDCHSEIAGAHTGDLSAEMLKNAGAGHIIVGHSERRTDHGEGDGQVRAKAEACYRAGSRAIICVGETLVERKAGKTVAVVSRQLKGSLPDGADHKSTIIAYEPVWAIGSGLTPEPGDIVKIHKAIRRRLVALAGEAAGGRMRILYGGSVKPSNARDILSLANVDGALVGGASLKAKDFGGIIDSYQAP
jgi:triosephosphate isomerase